MDFIIGLPKTQRNKESISCGGVPLFHDGTFYTL